MTGDGFAVKGGAYRAGGRPRQLAAHACAFENKKQQLLEAVATTVEPAVAVETDEMSAEIMRQRNYDLH